MLIVIDYSLMVPPVGDAAGMRNPRVNTKGRPGVWVWVGFDGFDKIPVPGLQIRQVRGSKRGKAATYPDEVNTKLHYDGRLLQAPFLYAGTSMINILLCL